MGVIVGVGGAGGRRGGGRKSLHMFKLFSEPDTEAQVGGLC